MPAASVSSRLAASELTKDLSFLLARANAVSLAAGNRALAPHGLKARSYSVLLLAAGDSGPSQRELAEFLRLDPSQVVSLVDDLQARELVERRPDPSDRRANIVVATAKGRALAEQARGSAAAAEAELHAELTVEQRRVIGEVLRTLAFPGE